MLVTAIKEIEGAARRSALKLRARSLRFINIIDSSERRRCLPFLDAAAPKARQLQACVRWHLTMHVTHRRLEDAQALPA